MPASTVMGWRNSQSVAFTRLEIVSKVPSTSGVFSVMCDEVCVHIGEAWNLKAHLLQLANVPASNPLQIVYELCDKGDLKRRAEELAAELMLNEDVPDSACPNGISFRI